MLLENLCNASGPSGYEGDVREIIKSEIKNYVDEIKVDRMGNIVAHKIGNGKKVVVDAHMDEVGFIITAYNEDGTLKFTSLGGINNKVVPCNIVSIGKNKIPGVIGLKPIHLQSKKEREENVPISKCCIDIGAKSKEEVRDLVSIGEYVVFTTQFGYFGEGLMKGKAFDDRIGCAVLIELLKENYNCDLYTVFNVQEEVGRRGAYVSAFDIKPDVAIAIEGTVCADMPNIEEHLMVTEIGKGPAISIMDSGSIYNPNNFSEIKNIADGNNIPYQIRKSTAGSNDAGSFVSSTVGAEVAAVAVPCRYIHSAISVCSVEDYENTIKLVREYLKAM
ncbi:M42 family metallopeptidase [Clostridium ganghwense]|uniref:M42 family metallopeptidase n=1 Tax=Clostridium ganghwense TaxID=312089 RepID=A0ABT4CUI8_9CLOT|nr:M42 family metallopeptidase [Clostridium ganghwense]MCY6372725.1 M42 family metallopeptidase [Clostridium ganghwense]